MPSQVTGHDDVVEQHGVGATVLEVDELLVDPLVGDGVGARRAQEIPGLRVGQRADPQAAQRRQIADAGVAAAGDQALREQVVRAREAHPRGARRRHLDAVHGDVERAPLQRRDQRRPIVLDHTRPHAERARQRVRQIDLEADQRAAGRRIFVGVRLAPLLVGAPDAARRALRFAPTRSPIGSSFLERRPRRRAPRREQRSRLPRARMSVPVRASSPTGGTRPIPDFVTTRPFDVTGIS